jgi:alpha-tubulin suppressor-like RCC1 family protein
VSGITSDTAFESGATHTCALLTGGTMACWGRNDQGQLGDGTTTDAHTPVAVVGISGATSFDGSELHTCAVVSGGVQCWGGNFQGELGNGTTTPSLSPVPVTGISTATAVSLGAFHSCARLSDGTVRCWGNNQDGQLGDGTTEDRHSPVAVSGITTATSVGAAIGGGGGGEHTCAVLSGGSVRCWGANDQGQLGDGNRTIDPVATSVAVLGITSAAQVAGGGWHTCARLTGGSVRCWGSGFSGELGDGRLGYSLTPVAVVGLPT